MFVPPKPRQGRARLSARRPGPLRQPAYSLGRRTNPEPGPYRPFPHGAGGPGADDHPGRRGHHPPGSNQHPAGGGLHQGVLRNQPVVPVHGPGKPAVGAHPPPPLVGPRTRRPLTGAGRLRGARRPLLPLRPDVPDRDPRRSQHRTHRRPSHLRTGQRFRLHRVPLPGREEGSGHRGDPLPTRRHGGGVRHRSSQRAPQPGQYFQKPPGTGSPVAPGRVPSGPPPSARTGCLLRRNHGDLLRTTRRSAVDGRFPKTNRLRGHCPHTLRRTRRRQPGPDGRQHAAPGRPSPTLRGALHRDRYRGARRPGRRRHAPG